MKLMTQALALVNTLYAKHSPHPYVVQMDRSLWQQMAMELADDSRVFQDYRDWDAVQIKNVRFIARRRAS